MQHKKRDIALGILVLVLIFLARLGVEAIWQALFPTCWRCKYSAFRTTYERNHSEAICAASTDFVDDTLIYCVESLQPCAIYYDDRWRVVRPYLYGVASRTSNWLLRALELSSTSDWSPVGYRTYRVDRIERAAKFPKEAPYPFEPKCFAPDNTIGPLCVKPIPEIIPPASKPLKQD